MWYVGFSNKPLPVIIEEDKYMYQQYIEGKIEHRPKFDILKFEDCTYTLSTHFTCATKSCFDHYCKWCRIVHKKTDEERKELKRIKNKQRYETNKEEILLRLKEYKEKNAEKIAQRAAEKIKCECGTIISRGSKSKHLKTKKHKDIIEGLKHDE